MKNLDPNAQINNVKSKIENFSVMDLMTPGVRGAMVYTTSAGISQIIQMLYALLMARWLGPDFYGILSACYVAGSLSVFSIAWGMDTWLLRKGSLETDPRELTGRILKIKMLFALIWGPALWLIFSSIRPDVYIPAILALSLIDIALENEFTTLSTTLTITNRVSLVSSLIILSRGLRLLSALALIFVNVKIIMPFVIARLSCTVIILVITLGILKPGVLQPQKLNIKGIIRESLPYGTSEFLAMVYGQVDVVMISLMINRTFVGLYAPAVSILNAIVSALSASYQFLIPRMTRKLTKASGKFGISAAKLGIGYFVIGLTLWAGIGIFGERIAILVLGDRYQLTGQLVRILSPILFLKSLSMFCAIILVAVDWQKQRIIPQIGSTATNVGLNLWAIPRFGVVGAANVFVVSEGILLLGYAYWTNSLLHHGATTNCRPRLESSL